LRQLQGKFLGYLAGYIKASLLHGLDHLWMNPFRRLGPRRNSMSFPRIRLCIKERGSYLRTACVVNAGEYHRVNIVCFVLHPDRLKAGIFLLNSARTKGRNWLPRGPLSVALTEQ